MTDGITNYLDHLDFGFFSSSESEHTCLAHIRGCFTGMSLHHSLALCYRSVISLRFTVKSLIVKEMKELAMVSIPSRMFYSFFHIPIENTYPKYHCKAQENRQEAKNA